MLQALVLTCPKDPSGSDTNEDKFAVDEASGRLALCDGASESYDSAVWAQVLAERFVRDPSLTPQWLSGAVAEYSAKHELDAMSWSQEAAYERGSFSTLLGVEYDRTQRAVNVLAIGDSVCVLVDGARALNYWPFSDPARFRERPTLLGTLPKHNAFVEAEDFLATRSTKLSVDGLGRALVCVTDALGEWLLRDEAERGSGLARLLELTADADFVDLVLSERAAGRMRVDDSTLLVLTFEKSEEERGLPDV